MGVQFKQFAGGGADLVTEAAVSYVAGGLDPLIWTVRKGIRGPQSTTDVYMILTDGVQMRMSRNGGVGNNVGPKSLHLTTLLNSDMEGVAQFSEGRVLRADVSTRAGPGVLMCGDLDLPSTSTGGDGGVGYYLAVNTTGVTLELRRASTDLVVVTGAIAAWVVNDLIRLEVRIPVPGTYELRSFQNGVLVDTTTDVYAGAGSGRPPIGGGFPGFHIDNLSLPTGTETAWDQQNFGRL